MTVGPRVLGVYGLALSGVDEAAEALVEAERSWPEYTVVNSLGMVEREFDRLGADRAELRLVSGGGITLDRQAGRVELITPRRLTMDEIVHPYLAPVAAVTARWHGRDAFHGGAFVLGTDVWGVLADREGGKSTTLAWLAAQGLPIACDDMLVLDEATPLAGPRVLDLRAEAAERLGVGEHLGLVGARERWRMPLPPLPPGAALRGWVFLAWGDDVRLERVAASTRVPRLTAHLGLRVPPLRPERLLELAALPAWELVRPRGWARFEEACARLLDGLES